MKSLLTNYIKERIKNIEIDPLLYNEPKKNLQYNSNFDINRIEMTNNDNLNINNNFYPNPNNEIGTNFANIGYSDLHGDLPNFNRGFNDNFGRPRGNLMGPEAFSSGGFGGLGGIGGVRYDPITPFGPKFDFIPQYDGPMRKKNPYSDIDIGIPQGGNGMNNFGGGGYNPFI